MTISVDRGTMTFMNVKDARSLTPTAQEALRARVVKAVRGGLSQVEAAATFEVARGTINRWCRSYEEQGRKALTARKRGRPAGSRLEPLQAARTVRWVLGRCPDQLWLPFALWTREAVQQLLSREFGVEVSVWTVGRYLKDWNLTPQKPLRRAFEQNPAAVRRWMDREYPAIVSAAKRLGAEIYWGDEMGLRSDHQTGTSYGRRGETPVIPGTGQRFRCNMISVITNRGRLYFMVFTKGFHVPVFLKFLKRLLRQVRRRMFLIVDGHPVHRAAAVKRWLAQQDGRIGLYFLPGYSPALNPDEMLNQDVKSNALGRRRPIDQEELIDDVRGYLRSTQKQPEVVKAYFNESHVRYAAA
jgi:transposase